MLGKSEWSLTCSIVQSVVLNIIKYINIIKKTQMIRLEELFGK